MAKKITCLLLALLMLIGACVVCVSAADDSYLTLTDKADRLAELGLFRGRDDGYALDAEFTRAQAVTMITRFLGAEEEALASTYETPFIDVPDWAAPYIGYTYTNKITNGSGDDIFLPDDIIPMNQFLTLVLRLLGYNDAEGDFTYTDPYELAAEVGLTSEYPNIDGFNRGTMVDICYRMLETPFKGQSKTVSDKLIEDGVFTEREYKSVMEITETTTNRPATTTTRRPTTTTTPRPQTTTPTVTTPEVTTPEVTTPTTTPEVTTPSAPSTGSDNFGNDVFDDEF